MPKWNLFLKCRTKTASCGNVDSEVTPPEVWDAQAPASHLSAWGVGGGKRQPWGSLEGEQVLWETPEMFISSAVSSGAQGAAAGSSDG